MTQAKRFEEEKKLNQERAPTVAEWVRITREVFGDDVKVLYAREGNFEVGRPA